MSDPNGEQNNQGYDTSRLPKDGFLGGEWGHTDCWKERRPVQHDMWGKDRQHSIVEFWGFEGGVEFAEGVAASCRLVLCLWVVWVEGRTKAERGQVLRRGGCEGRGRDESTRSEHVGGGCEWGRSWRGRVGGRLLVDGRGKVPIETSRAIPTHGGASCTDLWKLARVREEQEKCTHLKQAEHFSESLPTAWEHMEQD